MIGKIIRCWIAVRVGSLFQTTGTAVRLPVVLLDSVPEVSGRRNLKGMYLTGFALGELIRAALHLWFKLCFSLFPGQKPILTDVQAELDRMSRKPDPVVTTNSSPTENEA